MMTIEENKALKNMNTFGLDAKAKYFCAVHSFDEIREVFQSQIFNKEQHFILGGGSNILLTGDYDGLVIKNNITGKEVINENEDYVTLKVYSGEVWHDLVLHCVQNGWGGIENLSLIPGSVGAAPIQNIGAYGVELKDVFIELEAIHISSCKIESFDNSDCEFAYRQSIFKNKLKGQYFIYSITLKLSKKPTTNISYGAIKGTLEEMNIKKPDIKDVSNSVIKIRQSKLPDPSEIGNSGSFFKNPIISNDDFKKVKANFPDIIAYPSGEKHTKLAAGWLIEQCGFKGKRYGNTGAHEHQALVLVNYGNAKGGDIWNLALMIKKAVKEKFDVDIDPEVNII